MNKKTILLVLIFLFSIIVFGSLYNSIFPDNNQSINITFFNSNGGYNNTIFLNLSSYINLNNAYLNLFGYFNGNNITTDVKVFLNNTQILFIDGNISGKEIINDKFNDTKKYILYDFNTTQNYTSYINILNDSNISSAFFTISGQSIFNYTNQTMPFCKINNTGLCGGSGYYNDVNFSNSSCYGDSNTCWFNSFSGSFDGFQGGSNFPEWREEFGTGQILYYQNNGFNNDWGYIEKNYYYNNNFSNNSDYYTVIFASSIPVNISIYNHSSGIWNQIQNFSSGVNNNNIYSILNSGSNYVFNKFTFFRNHFNINNDTDLRIRFYIYAKNSQIFNVENPYNGILVNQTNGNYAGSELRYNTTENYPKNTYIDIGNYDNNYEFTQNITLNTSNTTLDFSSEIQNYLKNCNIDLYGNCKIPILISSSQGQINISNIFINYSSNITTKNFSNIIQNNLNNCSGFCNIYFNISSISSGIINLNNLNIFYNGSKIINMPINTRAVFYLNISHKATELEASGIRNILFAKDLSNNFTGEVYINYNNDTNLDFNGVLIDTDGVRKSLFSNTSQISSRLLNRTLLIPRSSVQTTSLIYCPNATTLININGSCSNVIIIQNGTNISNTYLSTIIINGSSYFKLDNISDNSGGLANAFPQMNTIGFQPTTITATQDINTFSVMSDGDNDTATIYLNWTVNGVVVEQRSFLNKVNGTNVSASLSETNYGQGDTIVALFIAQDSYGYGSLINSSIVVDTAAVIRTNISNPINSYFNINTTLYVNITDIDNNTIEWVNYTLIAPNGTIVLNNVNSTNISGDINTFTIWNTSSFNLSTRGVWNWNISIYDGYLQTNSYGFFDTDIPLVTLNKPNKNYGINTSIPLNYTVLESTTGFICSYRILETINSSNIVKDSTIVSCLNNTNYEITFNTSYLNQTLIFNVTDSYNNTNLTNVTFITEIDTTNPIISITSPSGTYSSFLNIPLIANISDTYLVNTSCWYKVETSIGGSTGLNNVSLLNCNNISSTFNLAQHGNYILYLYAFDEVGNLNTTQQSFTTAEAVSTGGGGGGGSSTTVVISSNEDKVEFEVTTDRDTNFYQFIASQGDTRKGIIKIKNKGKEFKDATLECVNSEICSWFKLKENKFSLIEKEVKEIEFEITVPLEAKKQDYPLKIRVVWKSPTTGKLITPSLDVTVKVSDLGFLFKKITILKIPNKAPFEISASLVYVILFFSIFILLLVNLKKKVKNEGIVALISVGVSLLISTFIIFLLS